MRRFAATMALAAVLIPAGTLAVASLDLDPVAVASPPEGEHGAGEHGVDEHGAGEHGEGHHGAFSISSSDFWLHWPTNEDPRTGMIYILLNFAVLAYAVEMLLLRNLRKGHAEKRASIVEQLDKASKARKEAESIISEYREKVDRLDDEVDEVMKAAQERAQADYARILEEAKADAEKIKASAKAQAEREAKMRVAKIEAEVVDQALAAAEAALRKQFGAAEQRKAVDDYVSEIADADLGKAS